MKRTVDLTQQHIFSGGLSASRNLLDLSLIQSDLGFPWKLRGHLRTRETAEELLRTPIFTGTASEREMKRLIVEDVRANMEGTFFTCPCCGRDMLPWHRTDGLCPSCINAVEYTFADGSRRFPWAWQQEHLLLGNTYDRVVLELNREEELSKPF